MVHEQADEARQLDRTRTIGALQPRLGGGKDRGDVAAAPRVGEREDRRLGAAGGELLDLLDADRIAVRPCCELLDLGRELVEAVAHELDERAAGVAVGLRADPRELLGDPFGELLLRYLVREDLARLRTRLREGRV